MRKVAIAYLTKDRVALSKRSIEPLLSAPVDVHWVDGSATDEGKGLFLQGDYPVHHVYQNVIGGPDAAVVYALTKLLQQPYEFIGLCENDVLLSNEWFEPVFSLFEHGARDGLCVGTVSARCYSDRVLFQRDGYSTCFNLGWGMQILTREAAQLTLNNMRTVFTTENRRIFAKLAGHDIGTYWAFRKGEHWLTADWGNDAMLASHGLASLALTPSPVQMIGQNPPLHQIGLTLVETPVEERRDDEGFKRYVENLNRVRARLWSLNDTPCGAFRDYGNGAWIYFAHHLPALGARYEGDWKLRWTQAFGPFSWQAKNSNDGPLASLTIPIAGSCDFLVSGGNEGGKVLITDLASGYTCSPTLAPESKLQNVMHIVVPASIGYREIKLEALSAGVTLYAIRVREPQPFLPTLKFNHSTLPPV